MCGHSSAEGRDLAPSEKGPGTMSPRTGNVFETISEKMRSGSWHGYD